MGFALDEVVPWGRSYEEYIRMFDLSEADLQRRILGCGDGPAGFNAVLTKRGGSVVSLDPIYAFDAAQIRIRISDTYETVMAEMRKNQSDYVWDVITSVEGLGRIRMSAMETFLSDFDSGKRGGRYVVGELPSLPFGDGNFDIRCWLFIMGVTRLPRWGLGCHLSTLARVGCRESVGLPGGRVRNAHLKRCAVRTLPRLG